MQSSMLGPLNELSETAYLITVEGYDTGGTRALAETALNKKIPQ